VLTVLAMTVHPDSSSFIRFPFGLIHKDAVNSTNVLFVILFAVLALFLNLIFAFRGNASPWETRRPKE
jgi:hypothetical protein